MKIPGFTTILLYQIKAKERMLQDDSIKQFTPSDLISNKWILEYFPENTCKNRWKEGCKLFYLLDKDIRPCSFGWVRNGTQHFVGEINRKLIFPFKVNCIFDCITPEKYRGKGYYPSLINRLIMIETICPNIIYASSSNVASNKGILKCGFKLTHKLYRILTFVRVKDLKKSSIKLNVR